MAPSWIKHKLLIKDLIKRLEAHPNVLKIAHKANYLKVTFDTGIQEHWALNKKGMQKKRSHLLSMDRKHFGINLINTYRQFGINKSFYPAEYATLKDHFIIKKKDFEKAGWCDARFKIQDLAVELVEEGYIPLQYTEDLLKKDFEDIANEPIGFYQHGLIRFSAFSHLPPSGRRLIMHFMPCKAEEKWKMVPLYNVINRLMSRDITREDIVYYLSKPEHLVRHPAFHRAVFKQWYSPEGKTVYDLHPDWGFRPLAILAEGGEYYCDSPNIDNLEKMGDFLGGVIDRPIHEHYDLIILSDVNPVKKEEGQALIAKYRNMSDHMMIVVCKEDLGDFASRYKPESVLRINNDMIRNAAEDNYILMIKSNKNTKRGYHGFWRTD